MLAMFPSEIVDFMLGGTLTKEQKKAVYAGLYENEKLLREAIDEEGCGAFFAAVRYRDIPQGTYTLHQIGAKA
jgi:hypothetical protein